jgi:hypothetical protein
MSDFLSLVTVPNPSRIAKDLGLEDEQVGDVGGGISVRHAVVRVVLK